MISNIKLQKISNKFDVGIVRIDLKFLFIRSTFFFQICDLKFLPIFLLLHSSLNLHNYFHFFPNKNCQVRKIWNQENMLVGEGGLTRILNAKISSNYVTFTSPKETKIKYILTSYIFINVYIFFCEFFQVV